MKFWLTLILSTVVLSGGITWLVMHQGAQGLTGDVHLTAPVTEPPETIFEGTTLLGNTIQIKAEPCVVDRKSVVEVPFKNRGKGPLRVQLLRTSCGCIHEITVNGTLMKPEGAVLEIPPGSEGKLTFSWTPKADQLASMVLKLSADFYLNDPQPQFSNGLRLEIESKIQRA